MENEIDNSKKQKQLNELFVLDKKKSAIDKVIEIIYQLIIEGKIESGDKLPSEYELSESLNISRTSIREAMKILSAFGIVEVKRGSGTFISDSGSSNFINPLVINLILTNDKDINKLVELREMMEFEIIRLILKKNTKVKKENLNKMEEIHEKMKNFVSGRESIDSNELLEYEIGFHQYMGRATDNQLVFKIYDFVLQFFRPYIKETFNNEDNKGKEAIQLHEAILVNLKKGDKDKSISAIYESIKGFKDLYENCRLE